MVEIEREGDVPKAAPAQQIATYNPARLTGRWTMVRSKPIGTVSNDISHTFGQANPPLNAPNPKQVSAANTRIGNNPTAV